jgi:hypothetical protein
MNNNIKKFIEQHIDEIQDGDFIKLYSYLHNGSSFRNVFVKELTDTLSLANIDVSEAREQLLRDMIQEFCEGAKNRREDFHSFLVSQFNWYGYNILEVTTALEQNAAKFNVELTPITNKLFQSQNYIISKS